MFSGCVYEVHAEALGFLQKLNNLEESLQEHQELNESLQKQLDESRIQERNEAELDERLREAEHTINHLKNNMRELEKKAAVSNIHACTCTTHTHTHTHTHIYKWR